MAYGSLINYCAIFLQDKSLSVNMFWYKVKCISWRVSSLIVLIQWTVALCFWCTFTNLKLIQIIIAMCDKEETHTASNMYFESQASYVTHCSDVSITLSCRHCQHPIPNCAILDYTPCTIHCVNQNTNFHYHTKVWIINTENICS